jgi:subtilisin family serine protease
MTVPRLGEASLPRLTGEGIRVAIVDSGAVAGHPHLPAVAGGVTITPGGELPEYRDQLGHGTAVAAAIHEKAPDAQLWIARVFVTRLAASPGTLVRAIDWSIAHGAHLINLSLGTSNPDHEPRLTAALQRAVDAGCRVVAAAEADGIRWLPGSLDGALGVLADPACPRHEVRWSSGAGRTFLVGSPYPRPIEGVPVERNLSGLSFAVANVTGVLARALQLDPASASLEGLALAAAAATTRPG